MSTPTIQSPSLTLIFLPTTSYLGVDLEAGGTRGSSTKHPCLYVHECICVTVMVSSQALAKGLLTPLA